MCGEENSFTDGNGSGRGGGGSSLAVDCGGRLLKDGHVDVE